MPSPTTDHADQGEAAHLAHPHWRRDAVGTDADSELCVPADRPAKLAPAELTAYIEQVEKVKHYCAVCVLKTACKRSAVDRGEEYSIGGGTTPEERRTLRCGVVPLFEPEAFDAEAAVAP